jgi:hypothetical protein
VRARKVAATARSRRAARCIFHPHPRDAVPWQLSTALVSRLASDDVVLTLVKDGDHRFLSRPEDIERLIAVGDQ